MTFSNEESNSCRCRVLFDLWTVVVVSSLCCQMFGVRISISNNNYSKGGGRSSQVVYGAALQRRKINKNKDDPRFAPGLTTTYNYNSIAKQGLSGHYRRIWLHLKMLRLSASRWRVGKYNSDQLGSFVHGFESLSSLSPKSLSKMKVLFNGVSWTVRSINAKKQVFGH